MNTHRKSLTGNRNRCAGCGEYFNSTGGFDRHRTGDFGKSRRCRTVVELSSFGWCKNKDGFWITEADDREHPSRLSHKGKTGVISDPTTKDSSMPNKSLLAALPQPLVTQSRATNAPATA